MPSTLGTPGSDWTSNSKEIPATLGNLAIAGTLTTSVIPTTAGMPAISKSRDPSRDTRNSRYTINRKAQEP
jgi:hypothetical protein